MVVRCQNCGTEVEVYAWQQPLAYVTRDADPFGPATFVMIGAGWLIHRCVIANATT